MMRKERPKISKYEIKLEDKSTYGTTFSVKCEVYGKPIETKVSVPSGTLRVGQKVLDGILDKCREAIPRSQYEELVIRMDIDGEIQEIEKIIFL